jgi:hypothetical protein
MTPHDYDLVEKMVEDLTYLRDEWAGSIADAALRRGSTTLRRLLVNGDYGKAWRLVGFRREPRLDALDLAAEIRGYGRHPIVWAQAGGAETQNGIHVGMVVIAEGSLTPEEAAAQNRTGTHERSYALTEYLNSPSFQARLTRHQSTGPAPYPITVSRRKVILYVANKKGGAHHDAAREATDDEFLLLDQISEGGYRVVDSNVDRNAVYYELLSIGQAVGRSQHAQMFIQRAQEMLGSR